MKDKPNRMVKEPKAQEQRDDDKKVLNNVTLLSERLNDLYRAKKMNSTQASTYLKLKDMLKPGYKPTLGEKKITKVQIRQQMKPLYLEITSGV